MGIDRVFERRVGGGVAKRVVMSRVSACYLRCVS